MALPVQNVPTDFESSYQRHEWYPINLVYKSCHDSVVEAYRTRLNDLAGQLFSLDPLQHRIVTLDCGSVNQGI